MTGSRLNLVAVGSFVLLAVASLVVALALLAGRTGNTDTYYTYYANVSGLKFGSQVFYEGYPIGQVDDIDPVQRDGRTEFRVRLAVSHGWKIPEDSVARSTSTGLLNPQVIAIRAGHSAHLLRPGDTIRSAPASDLFANVNSTAEAVGKLTENVNRQIAVFGEVMQRDVQPMAHQARQLVGTTASALPPILENTRQTTENLAQASQRLDQFLDARRLARLDRVLAEAETATAHLSAASRRLDRMTRASATDLQATVRNLRLTSETLAEHAGSITRNLDEASRNLNQFSRNIRDNPGALLRSTPPPDNAPPP